MALTITRLKFRRRGAAVEVHINGGAAFCLDALSAARLAVGQTLDADQLAALQEDAAQGRAWRQALAYLGRRDRSRREMEAYLQRKGCPESIRGRIVERLEAENYLNDAAFARKWVESRLRTSPRGRRALGYELRQKGIEARLIAGLLSDVSEEGPAWTAAQSRLRQWRGLDPQTLQSKMRRFLAGRGFSSDTIRRICGQVRAQRRSPGEQAD